MGETVPFNRGNQRGEEPGAPTKGLTSRVYTNEEVSEIIRAALNNAENRQFNTVNHEEMLAIGKDFGLSAEDIARAVNHVDCSQEEKALTERAALMFKLAFRIHLMVFATVNTGLFLINLVADPSFWWFLYPLISWGSVVALHGLLNRYAPALSKAIVSHARDHSIGFLKLRQGSNVDSGRATFTIDDLYASMGQAKGLAEVRDDSLALEFEVSDTVLGIFKSGVREVEIPFSEIAGLRAERKMWKIKLTIQTRRMASLKDIPGAEAGEIKLVFANQARQAAENLITELTEKLG